MIPYHQLTGVVLAGGQTSRSDANTTLAACEEETQLQHALELLKPFCKEVFIGGGVSRTYFLNGIDPARLHSRLRPSGRHLYGVKAYRYSASFISYLRYAADEYVAFGTAFVGRTVSGNDTLAAA